ncbi:MAG: hypothetical protein ABIA93_02110 [Candidatus Woesearchaeota archaeon]
MRVAILLSVLFLVACTSQAIKPDFTPLQDEIPEGWMLENISATFRNVSYTENPGMLLPEHYNQLYNSTDNANIESVYYVYLSKGANITANEMGYFAIKYSKGTEAELQKLKDYVYLKDIRNFYIGRKDDYIIQYWSNQPTSPDLRKLFYSMKSRLEFEEIQPIG